MSLTLHYGDAYELISDWLDTQRAPFIATPNLTARRSLERRLAADGKPDRALAVGRLGRLAADLLGPDEEAAALPVIVQRELAKRSLPKQFQSFADHVPFLDRIVRELDDLRRNTGPEPRAQASRLIGLREFERVAFGEALDVVEATGEMAAPLRHAGWFLGGEIIRAATTYVRRGKALPWTGVAVAGVHRLDNVSRELLVALGERLPVVVLPGPRSPSLELLAQEWGFLVGKSGAPFQPLRRLRPPVVRAYVDKDRELWGVLSEVVSALDGGVAPSRVLLAAPRADAYAEAFTECAGAFGLSVATSGLVMYHRLPVDAFVRSLLGVLTARPERLRDAFAEVLERTVFDAHRLEARRLTHLVHEDGAGRPDAWVVAARTEGWPDWLVSRLERLAVVLLPLRAGWDAPQSGLERLTGLVGVLEAARVFDRIGRDLQGRAGKSPTDALRWEGQGSRGYHEALVAFRDLLEAGQRVPELGLDMLGADEFGQWFTSQVSHGSYLPAQLDGNAIRLVDYEDTFLEEADHLWLLGFAEGEVPRPYSMPILVPERVRSQLTDLPLGTRTRHLRLERTNFEKTLEVPRISLSTSFPYLDEQGRARLPSPLAVTYGLLDGDGVKRVFDQRERADVFFGQDAARPRTPRQIEGLALAAWTGPMPEASSALAWTAGVAKAVSEAAGPAWAERLERGSRYVNPSNVVSISEEAATDRWEAAVSHGLWDGQLLDGNRCEFRVFARTLLGLRSPRPERFPTDPSPLLRKLLAALLADPPAGLSDAARRPGLVSQAARRLVVDDETFAARSLQAYAVRETLAYLSRVLYPQARRVVVEPSRVGERVEVAVPRSTGVVTVRTTIDRVDVADDESVVVLYAGESRLVKSWFAELVPGAGGKLIDPRLAVGLLGANADALELHALGGKQKPPQERWHARVDGESDGSGDCESHLGVDLETILGAGLRKLLRHVESLATCGEFRVVPRLEPSGALACTACRFGPLCQEPQVDPEERA